MSDQYDIDSVDNQRRRDLGLQVLSRIDGDAGQSVIESLSTSNPALGHHIAAFAFGDIYDRPGLDARSRQLVTIGVLTALGGCEPQLKVHVGAALNVGISAFQPVSRSNRTSLWIQRFPALPRSVRSRVINLPVVVPP